MKNIFILLFALSLSLTNCFAQKVKYKDLFILLRSENYHDADNFLRIYLQQEPEDPHANYSMGKMLQSYLDDGDLLNGSARLKELADSSVFYFNRALELTTEKFVKKNDDDLYADFRRRDLRTGKFEVKFSDVQFDIEERIGVVEKFTQDLEALLGHFQKAREFYANCQDLYQNLTKKFPDEKTLYFTTTTDDINEIRSLAQLYDSSLYQLNTYRVLMKGMGKSAVNQELKISEIQSYPEGGLVEPDFYAETINYLNYKQWAQKSVDIVLKQIFPLKKRLISFDIRVKELHDQVVDDSLDKRDEVFQLATENVGRDLRDYDAKSLPAAIFNYRIAEINYHSAINYWLKEVSDTIDIGLRQDMLLDFKNQISGISKLVNKLEAANNQDQLRLFNEYVTVRYDGADGISQFIIDHVEEVKEDSVQMEKWLAEVSELDKIAIWNTDSIALTEGSVLGPASRSFTTVIVDTLATRTFGFYSWKKTADSVSLSFGVAPSSRKVDTLFQVPITNAVIDKSLPLPSYIVDTIGLSQKIWILQSSDAVADSSYLAQIFLTDYTLGPSWNREINLPTPISAIQVDQVSNNFIILGENDTELAVLDKYGELVVNREDGTPENNDNEEQKGNSPQEERQH